MRQNPSLMRALLATHKKKLIAAGILSFCEENIRLGIVILISRLILYFEEQEGFSEWIAYTYAIAILIAAIFAGVIQHYNFYSIARIGWHMRVGLCGIIYEKTLRLSQQSLSNITSGRIINLVATDVLRFDQIPIFLNYLWIGPVQCITTASILSLEFDLSILAGMAVLCGAMTVQIICGRILTKVRTSVAECTDQRIQLVNEILVGMRIIRMNVWEKPFASILNKARKREIWKMFQSAALKSSTMALFLTQEKVIALVTITIYVLNGGLISAFKVFYLIGLVGALRVPAGFAFLYGIERASEAIASAQRIQQFLLSEESNELWRKSTNINNHDAFVEMKNFSSKWNAKQDDDDASDDFCLDRISCRVEANQLLVVVGSVGSGKTSMLQAILREIPATSGKIVSNGEVSYAGQIPWIFAGSVRDNILFGSKFDSDMYQSVVSACCLEKDLKLLPNGDQTLIGERGTTLSGGQKSRINLARAAYRNSQIILMDDPLSSIDPTVSRKIHERCILGLLKDKLRILVTHQTHLLKTADRILVIQKGKIVGCGTYDELKANHLELTSLFDTAKRPSHEFTTSYQGEDEISTGNESVGHDFLRNRGRASQRSIASATSFAEDTFNEQVGTTVPDEVQKSGSVELQVYREYFRLGTNVLVYFAFILLIIATHSLSILTDWWLSKWTSSQKIYMNTSTAMANITLQRQSNRSEADVAVEHRIDMSIKNNLIIYSVFSASLVVVTILKMNLNSLICISASYHMHKKMLSALLRAPIRFFDTNPVGRILNRFSKDMGQTDEMLPIILMEFIHNCGQIASVVLLVAIVNYFTLIIILPSIIYFIWLRRYYLKSAREIKRLEGASRSPVFTTLSTTLQGLITVRSFSEQERFIRIFHETQDCHSAAWFLCLTGSRWFGFRLDLISAVFLGVAALASVAAATLLEINPGEVGLILTQSASCIAIFQWGVRQSANVENLMTSVERIQEYYCLQPEAPEEIPETKPLDTWPSQGSIEFRQVSFAYEKNGPVVLKEISAFIRPKEKIGLVGRTGAGKSSVISALFRLSELTNGEIYIDGVGISSIGLADLRKKISIIPQDPTLFKGPLRRNLDPFHQYSDDDLWDVLRQVQLFDFVMRHPAKLDAVLAEAGSNFSVGQRQLVCLARAILCKNKILVVDEATANVDIITDRYIQAAIRKSFFDCTVITIAHRINTIIDSDRIIVLESGVIKEFDRPFLLLQKKGVFSSMVDSMGERESLELRRMAENVFNSEEGTYENM